MNKHLLCIDGANLGMHLKNHFYNNYYDKIFEVLRNKTRFTEAKYFLVKQDGFEVENQKISKAGFGMEYRDSVFIKKDYIKCEKCDNQDITCSCGNRVKKPNTDKYKCDVDASIVHFVHIRIEKYDKFSFVSNDGDYVEFYEYLQRKNKLGYIISPDSSFLSGKITKSSLLKNYIINLNDYYSLIGKARK
jgi:hypothetical protein